MTALPLNPAGIDFDLPVFFEGRPQPGGGEAPQADFRIATIDYFRTMGIPLLQGREFTEFDGPGARDVVIVNDAFVKRHLPGENPVGKRIIFYSRPREIIGVVGSVRHYGFRRDPNPEMIVSNCMTAASLCAARAMGETVNYRLSGKRPSSSRAASMS